MKPIKLSELSECLDFESLDYEFRVDTQNGCIVMVESSLLRALEEGAGEDLDAWTKEEVKIAKAIVDDTGNRFLIPPDKFDFHAYRHMEDFIKSLEDDQAADQLWRAIKGKGAFRYFKDTAHQLGLLDQWYQYENDAKKQQVMEWAKAEGIPYQDDRKNRE